MSYSTKVSIKGSVKMVFEAIFHNVQEWWGNTDYPINAMVMNLQRVLTARIGSSKSLNLKQILKLYGSALEQDIFTQVIMELRKSG